MYLFDYDKIDQQLQQNNYDNFIPSRYRLKTKKSVIEFLSSYLHPSGPKIHIRKTTKEYLFDLLSELEKITKEKREYFQNGWKKDWSTVIEYKRKQIVQKLNAIGYNVYLDGDRDIRISDTDYFDFSWTRPDRRESRLNLIKVKARFYMPEYELSLGLSRKISLFDYDGFKQADCLTDLFHDGLLVLNQPFDEQKIIEEIKEQLKIRQEKKQKANEVYQLFFTTIQEIEDDTNAFAATLGLVWGQFEQSMDVEDVL